MFIVFKSWFRYNLEHKFTSLEVAFVFRQLLTKIQESKLTLHTILTELVKSDPVKGICHNPFNNEASIESETKFDQ